VHAAKHDRKTREQRGEREQQITEARTAMMTTSQVISTLLAS
jgi:hypothetical protein